MLLSPTVSRESRPDHDGQCVLSVLYEYSQLPILLLPRFLSVVLASLVCIELVTNPPAGMNEVNRRDGPGMV